MRLQLSTWPEVENYLTRSTGIIMPIGSTEQHGPNGLIGTDAITAEEVAWRVGEREQALVAPTINVGMAQHHLGFPGSMALRPSTLIALIGDYVAGLARHGFDRFFFVNGHGGNVVSVRAAFDEIHSNRSLGGGGAPLRCALQQWYQTGGVSAVSKKHFGNAEGQHATPSEVALTQHVYPDHIKSAEMSPEVAPTMQAFADADDFRRLFPDGRAGSNPALATPEIGAEVLEAAVEGVAANYAKFMARD